MKNKLIVTATVALASFVIGGCASTPWGNESASTIAAASEIELQKAELARKEEALAQQQLQLEAERVRLTDVRNELESAATQTSRTGTRYGLTPLDLKPGECYAQVIIPAKYKITSERVVKREKSDRIEIIPARYETVKEKHVVKEKATRLEVIPAQYEIVQERVLVKPATTKLEVVPAVYETIAERVLVKPATTKLEVVPAVYETIEESVVDQPARTEWMLGDGIGTRSGVAPASATQTIERYGDYKVLETRVEDTGELMCLVEIPATYKIIKKEVLKEPASTRRVESSEAVYQTVKKTVLKTPATTRKVESSPAVYQTVKKTVLKTPSKTREVEIPAEYRTVEVTKMVQPARERHIPIAAEYRTVEVTKEVQPASERHIPIAAEYRIQKSKEKISDERIEWRPVLCELNMNRENVQALQSALNEKGSCQCGPNGNECQVDGVLGQCTYNGVQRFAEQNGLSWGNNYVTLDVIRALGLNFGSDEGNLRN